MGLFLDHARSTDLYRSLCQVFESPDGNLLEQTEDRLAEAQTEFLRWALHEAQPSVIIETGTNKGLFSYFVSLVARGVTIHTFDRDPRAGEAVELVNRSQQNVRCVFHDGDTRQTLGDFGVAAEFAWIDGGHDADIPLSDLMACYRLRVPYVAADDTAYPTVREAVEYLTRHTPYTVAGNPFREHDRRQALLLRLPPEERARSP